MKQTAVEWLVEQFEVSHSYINEIFKESIEQAKELEKEQIILSHINGQSEYDSQAFSSTNKKIAEQYYNETFKNK
jgi:hypothetical protein